MAHHILLILMRVIKMSDKGLAELMKEDRDIGDAVVIYYSRNMKEVLEEKDYRHIRHCFAKDTGNRILMEDIPRLNEIIIEEFEKYGIKLAKKVQQERKEEDMLPITEEQIEEIKRIKDDAMKDVFMRYFLSHLSLNYGEQQDTTQKYPAAH